MAFLLMLSPAVAGGWSTFGHDAQRTSKAEVVGPASVESTLTVELADGQSINMPPVVTDSGLVLAGTWGMVRSGGESDRSQWDKFDGALFAFDESLAPLWRHQPDLTPWCYSYDGRSNAEQCPDGGEVNTYNGTVEGTPAVGEAGIFFGRGDGKVYAVTEDGDRIWTFSTFNPEDTADPEGGGEVVGGPALTPDGAVVFGTIAAGDYETNAIYAVEQETGTLRWRYPDADRGLDVILLAPPALSPDGATVYLGGAWGPTVDFNAEAKGVIWALDVASGELRWSFEPVAEDLWWAPQAWIQRIAVGADGTIYASGSESTLDAGHAVVMAITDDGDHATDKWGHWPEVDGNAAQWTLGLALDEVDGQTWRIVLGSSNAPILGAYPDGGGVVAIDAATGDEEWEFLPRAQGWAGGVTGVSLDANGNVYATVSGASDGGRVFALDDAGALTWSVALGGQAEWGSPVLGPDGAVYVGDTRQCALRGFPIEDGYCDSVNITPTLYAIRGDSEPLDTGRTDTVPTDTGDCGGGCGGAMGAPWLVPALGLAVGRRRRPGLRRG